MTHHSGEKAADLTLYVGAGEATDAEELDRLTRSLLAELGEVELESVELAGAVAIPEGAKTAEAVTLGALAVAVLPTLMPRLIEFLLEWSMRGKDRTVKIKTQIGDRSVELECPTSTSPAQLKSIVDTLTGALGEKEQARVRGGAAQANALGDEE